MTTDTILAGTMNANRIRTIEEFFSPEECQSFLDVCQIHGFKSQYAGDGRLIRSRSQFEDQFWANLIWERLESSLPKLADVYAEGLSPDPNPSRSLDAYAPVQLNERFRCYKYGADEEFRRHQDFAHEYSDTKRTFLTVLIYLNEGYAGGETSFDDFCVKPKLGMLAMFPHELEHEGCKIVSGVKFTLRTDVVYESVTK